MRSVVSASALAVALSVLAPISGAMAQDVPTELANAFPANDSTAATISFARDQVAGGELSMAAAALERVLLANPDAHDARAVYASVLCRLDDRQGASVELGLLKGHPVDPAYWSDVTAACGNVQQSDAGADDGFGWSGEVAAGLQWDSDASGAMSTQFDFNIPGLPASKDGFSVLSSAKVDYKGQGLSDGGFFYLGGSLRSKNAIDGPDNDYLSGEFRTGIGGVTEGHDWQIGSYIRHVRVFNEPLYTEVGGQGEIGWSAGEDARIAVKGELGYQSFHEALYKGAFVADVGNDQTGVRGDLAVEYQRRIGDTAELVIGAGADHKSAEKDSYGYSGFRLYGAYRTTLSDAGTYGSLTGLYRYVNYNGGSTRHDHRCFVRAALGTPLTSTGLNIEAGVSYTMRESTTFIADYHSVGADLRLIWRFGK